MSETFCGKSCLNCTHKESLACHGCKSKLGDPLVPECRLANCCTEKEYRSCNSCDIFGTCSAVQRERIPEQRLHSLVVDAQLHSTNAPKEKSLHQYFLILFILVFLQIFSDIWTNNYIEKTVPSLYSFTSILAFMIPLIYAFVLFAFSDKNDLYRVAGGCLLADSLISTYAATFPVQTHTLGWVFSLLMISLGCVLYGTHREFHAHSELLKCIDYPLSEKWQALWKWFLITNSIMYGSLILIMILPNFALLLTLAGILGNVAGNIIKLIYLYQTTNLLKAQSANSSPKELSANITFFLEESTMPESYCGKNCTTCTYADALSCSGCRSVFNKPLSDECTLAKCCANKGLTYCSNCAYHETCSDVLREGVTTFRLNEQIARGTCAFIPERHASLLSKSIMILFLLFIPQVISTLMTHDRLVDISSPIYTLGLLLSMICSIIYGTILLSISATNTSYRNSGLCHLATVLLLVLTSTSGFFLSDNTWMLNLLKIISAGLVIGANVLEHNGHSAVLHKVNAQLSKSWIILRNCYLISLASIFGYFLIPMLTFSRDPAISSLLLSIIPIGIMASYFTKLLFLFETALIFRKLSADSDTSFSEQPENQLYQ